MAAVGRIVGGVGRIAVRNFVTASRTNVGVGVGSTLALGSRQSLVMPRRPNMIELLPGISTVAPYWQSKWAFGFAGLSISGIMACMWFYILRRRDSDSPRSIILNFFQHGLFTLGFCNSVTVNNYAPPPPPPLGTV